MIEGGSPIGRGVGSDIALVMPMAGRGSRFGRAGHVLPKPLIDLGGKPFFWWAAESVRRSVRVREMVCVVLAEHVEVFEIDVMIRSFYPDARIVAIPDVTAGAAETAAIGIAALQTGGPFAVNDSDHAFDADLACIVGVLEDGADAALLCFASADPAYSYVRTDSAGAVVGTAEKQVVGPDAIAGCYAFADPGRFLRLFEGYRQSCTYDELFMSGLYDRLIANGGKVQTLRARSHIAFGTPEEVARVDLAALRRMHGAA